MRSVCEATKNPGKQAKVAKASARNDVWPGVTSCDAMQRRDFAIWRE